MTSLVKRNRILKREEDVFTQNAWDDTNWTEEMLSEAQLRLQQQKDEAQGLKIVTDNIEADVVEKWDQFYSTHGDKFFKDRQWIFSEFPEIIPHLNSSSSSCRILEVGCGVGNAVAYLINSNSNPNLHIYCCDISPSAIETLKKRDFYLNNSDKLTAFPADICKDIDSILGSKIKRGSIDFLTIIFTLSALKPDLVKDTIRNLASFLKPGAMILFRDYGRYDLTQLRFKGKSYLAENYYVRADGTTSYFFTEELIDNIFTSAGLVKVELKQDNRMLVNRSKSLKMCRCWIQAKYARRT